MTTDSVPTILREIPGSDIADSLEMVDCMACLDDDSRALVHVWLAGYPQQQIAALFGTSQAGVSRALADVCSKMRE